MTKPRSQSSKFRLWLNPIRQNPAKFLTDQKNSSETFVSFGEGWSCSRVGGKSRGQEHILFIQDMVSVGDFSYITHRVPRSLRRPSFSL